MQLLDVTTIHRRGIYEDMPREDYFSTVGLNPSTIVKRRKSAKAAKHAYEQDSKDTDAMMFGRCCHSLLFEPDRFDHDWAIAPQGIRRGTKAWDAFVAESAGKQIIKDGDQQYGFRRAAEAVRAALDHAGVRDLVIEGRSEVAVFTEEHGLQCKGLMDRIDTIGSNLIDAKFTSDIRKEVFGRSAANFGYHIKMACYKTWFERESGKKLNGVYLITVETESPYDVAVVPIEDQVVEDGWAQAQDLIAQLATDIRTNRFPGVDEGQPHYELQLPFWALLDEQLTFDGADEIEV